VCVRECAKENEEATQSDATNWRKSSAKTKAHTQYKILESPKTGRAAEAEAATRAEMSKKKSYNNQIIERAKERQREGEGATSKRQRRIPQCIRILALSHTVAIVNQK